MTRPEGMKLAGGAGLALLLLLAGCSSDPAKHDSVDTTLADEPTTAPLELPVAEPTALPEAEAMPSDAGQVPFVANQNGDIVEDGESGADGNTASE